MKMTDMAVTQGNVINKEKIVVDKECSYDGG